MTTRTKSWIVLFVLTLLVRATGASAAEPSEAAARAEELHKQAVAAFDKGRRAEAIEFWRQANGLHPFWKYAYNLSNTLYLEQRFEEAWPIGVQARAGTPEQYRKTLDQLQAKLGVELTKTHAWLAIEVVPDEAKVLRNKLPWLPPRAIWTRDESSLIEIQAEGYQPQAITLAHRPGDRLAPPAIVLVPNERGELVVTGSPEGAAVRVGDSTVGALPRVALPLAPGTYLITIEHDDYVPRQDQVTIANGSTFELPVALKKKVAVTPDRGLSAQQTIGLVVAGGGVVAGVVSGLLFLSASDTAEEMQRLNDDPPTEGFATYTRRYDALASDRDAAELGAWIALGVGGAALATGVVLFITGAPAGPPASEGHVEVGVGVLPGGASVTSAFAF